MKVTKKVLRSSRKMSLRESVSQNNRLYAVLPVRATRHPSPHKPLTQQSHSSSTPVAKKETKEKAQETPKSQTKASSTKAQANAKHKDTPDGKQSVKRSRLLNLVKNEEVGKKFEVEKLLYINMLES